LSCRQKKNVIFEGGKNPGVGEMVRMAKISEKKQEYWTAPGEGKARETRGEPWPRWPRCRKKPKKKNLNIKKDGRGVFGSKGWRNKG